MEVINPQGIFNCTRYHSAVKKGNMIFVSGRIALNAQAEVVHPNDAAAQTHYIMEDLARILKDGGASLKDIVQIHTYALCPEDIPAIHKARQEHMGDHRPPHTGIEVQIPSWKERGIRLEIEVTALVA